MNIRIKHLYLHQMKMQIICILFFVTTVLAYVPIPLGNFTNISLPPSKNYTNNSIEINRFYYIQLISDHKFSTKLIINDTVVNRCIANTRCEFSGYITLPTNATLLTKHYNQHPINITLFNNNSAEFEENFILLIITIAFAFVCILLYVASESDLLPHELLRLIALKKDLDAKRVRPGHIVSYSDGYYIVRKANKKKCLIWNPYAIEQKMTVDISEVTKVPGIPTYYQ